MLQNSEWFVNKKASYFSMQKSYSTKQLAVNCMVKDNKSHKPQGKLCQIFAVIYTHTVTCSFEDKSFGNVIC